ncbi:MAG: hypothetical protein J1F35_05775 [Erysipelotrichales bacterium]|nr:hypothetical protein [Erysipelotrichales bacterium]
MNLKLISNLNFGEKLNSQEAVTESGKNFLKNYKAYVFGNDVSYSLVNGFIREANKFTFDTGIMSILESVLTYVNENRISWKLSSACESINSNNAQYNYIAKMGVGQVEKLLEMKENEVVQYIKAGALKNLQYIPEFRSICKEVYRTNVVEETYAPNYSLTNPVTYLHIDEGNTYFSILGKTFKFANDVVEEAVCDDMKFNRINSLLPNFKKVEENLEYTYNHGIYGKAMHFTISENLITFETGNFKQTFESVAGFKEYADVFARTLIGNEKTIFLNTVNSIGEVYEAMENICEIDTAKVLETSTGDVLSIIEAKDNVNVTVYKSAQCGTSSTNFEYMNEALANIKKVTNLNLSSIYENRINEDAKRVDPNSYESIKEQLEVSKKAKIASRREKIAMLAEEYKNDPVKIAMLNGIAKELSLLED